MKTKSLCKIPMANKKPTNFLGVSRIVTIDKRWEGATARVYYQVAWIDRWSKGPRHKNRSFAAGILSTKMTTQEHIALRKAITFRRLYVAAVDGGHVFNVAVANAEVARTIK